jgi:predicted O-methyltransferase YrrM
LQPRRIIEVGTAIGYTSVCMASAAAAATIDTIDSDPAHIELASIQIEKYGFEDRVKAQCGETDAVLPKFYDAHYDLAFFDGFAPTYSILNELQRLLRPGRTLVCANLTLGGDGDQFLGDVGAWMSHSLGETAIAVKR